MDTDDKPFACSFPGCNQKFVTEDRLSCHIQKHDINFENIAASLFADQTPTPTTFLRDCENIGLFQELPLTSKNPFDESFRKAVDVNIESDGVDSPSIPILPDSANLLGMINTPTTGKDTPNFMKFRHVFLTPDVDKLQSQISNDNLDTPSLDNISSIPLLHRISIDTPTTSSSHKKLVLGLPHYLTRNLPDSAGSEPAEADGVTKETSSPCITPSSDGTISSTCPSQSPLLGSECSLTPTPTQPVMIESVTTSTSMQIRSITQNNVSSTTKSAEVTRTLLAPTLLTRTSQLPQTVSVPQTFTTASSIIQPATTSGQSLVMLHVNKSGEAYLVPANQMFAQANKTLPVKVAGSSSSTITTNGTQLLNNGITVESMAAAPAAVPTDSSHTPLTLAKMKLKQALTKHHSLPPAESVSHQSDGEFSTRSRHSSSASGVRKRSLSRSDEELDEEEKKRKNLQRNRDAARRCRKKKKFFIQALEDKLKTTNLVNTQLQSENAKLKMEIVELKSLFIAHKDCDVTKMQLSEGSLNSLLLGKSTAAREENTHAADKDNIDHMNASKHIMGNDMYIS